MCTDSLELMVVHALLKAGSAAAKERGKMCM